MNAAEHQALPSSVQADAMLDHLAAVFDVQHLRAMCARHPGFRLAVNGLMQKLIAQGQAPIKQARQAWQAGKNDQVIALFHTLRGSLGMLGAADFQDIAGQIEMAIQNDPHGQNGPEAQIAILFDIAAQRLQVLVDAAELWQQHYAHADTYSTFDKKTSNLDATVLGEFKSLLVQKNMRACDVYAQIRSRLAGTYAKDKLDELDQRMQELDFEHVLALLG
ncbi:MAG: hypothetical protein NVS3B3_19650 [Aquirhabdus sp.]